MGEPNTVAADRSLSTKITTAAIDKHANTVHANEVALNNASQGGLP
jgi:hypothetical protein